MTRNQRASVLGLGLASLLVLPLPDGTVSAGDRQQLASSYASLAVVVVTATADYIVRIPADDHVVRIPADDHVVLIPADDVTEVV